RIRTAYAAGRYVPSGYARAITGGDQQRPFRWPEGFGRLSSPCRRPRARAAVGRAGDRTPPRLGWRCRLPGRRGARGFRVAVRPARFLPRVETLALSALEC